VLSTESFRARIRRVISENFFSTRYDYRVEWLRCIATLSAGNGGEALSVRAIRAIADVVDSPGGVLWVENGCGRYHVERCLNMPMDMNASEIESEQFIQRFQKGTVVQVFETSETSGPNHSPVPPWANETSVPWLAIPLVRVDQTIGFVVLALPRTPMTLNWESFDLLLAIGQQVAGYLSEDRATRSLLESKSLIDFSQKFSFVVHDIKNISGQLGMMVANIRAFGDDPEFRADLIRSLESGVRKLQALLDKLRPNSGVREDTKTANPASVIDATVRELTRGDVALWTEIAAGELSLRMDPAVLQAIITHLVTNAIEASQAGGTVVVRLREEKERAIIEIADEGCGMTPEFVRNGLFVPFKTTKERGHGVGAYQARELLRAASGDLEVFSKPGSGTTMRLLIPCVAGPTREAAEMVAAR
jgi:putative PEP-CTERM system histidine kinase